MQYFATNAVTKQSKSKDRDIFQRAFAVGCKRKRIAFDRISLLSGAAEKSVGRNG